MQTHKINSSNNMLMILILENHLYDSPLWMYLNYLHWLIKEHKIT